MDVKALAGTMHSGRRNALAGLLTGAAVLIGRSTDTEARRRRCPRCPKRVCCTCDANSPNRGCQFGPAPSADADANAICEKVCGGPGTVANAVDAPSIAGVTLVCAANNIDCVFAGCPLY